MVRPISLKPPFWYLALSAVLLPMFAAHTVVRAWRDGGLEFLRQRFGFVPPRTTAPVWFHATSVGEVNTLLPLLDLLRQRYPNHRWLVTTTTPTGKAALLRAGTPFVEHAYLPLDYEFAINRFFMRCRPMTAIMLETEIWPCLYHQCRNRNIPLLIINGRISAKTARVSGSLLANTYAQTLRCVTQVLARSSSDATLFTQLAQQDADATSLLPPVSVIGNLKFAMRESHTIPSPLVQRPYCLLASTHTDEEICLTRRWLKRQRPELLIVVPRHPNRSEKLIAQLGKLTPELRVRSKGEQPLRDTRVYLADTLGELQAFYAHASAVFVGGSLCEVGGHNVLEPSRFGCAIVVGPHMYNFEEELALLAAANGIVQCPDSTSTVQTLCDLLDSEQQRATLGRNAQDAVFTQQEIASDYADAVAIHLHSG